LASSFNFGPKYYAGIMREVLATVLEIYGGSSPSVRSLTFAAIACILQVLSNYLVPLIGQIIGICLYFTSIEQFSDAIDRSDHRYLLVFYMS